MRSTIFWAAFFRPKDRAEPVLFFAWFIIYRLSKRDFLYTISIVLCGFYFFWYYFLFESRQGRVGYCKWIPRWWRRWTRELNKPNLQTENKIFKNTVKTFIVFVFFAISNFFWRWKFLFSAPEKKLESQKYKNKKCFECKFSSFVIL